MAEDERWHKYFRELSIMQSIYAVPQGSNEHHRVAVFLFKFRRTAANETALTTWHHLIKSESLDHDADHIPDRIETSQFGSAMKQDPTPWQSQHPSITGLELRMDQHNTDEWIYPTTMTSASELCAYTPQNITPTESEYSGQSNVSLGSNSQGSSSLSTFDCSRTATDEVRTTTSYQDLNQWPTQRVELPEATYRVSQQTVEQGCTTSQMLLHYEGINLTQLPMEDFSFGTLHQLESLAVEKPFDFSEPPILPFQTSPHISDSRFSTGYEPVILASEMYAPQPRRIISTARLSSPIVLEGQIEEEVNPHQEVGVSSLQCISHKHSEEVYGNGQYFGGQLYQSHDQDQHKYQGYEVDDVIGRTAAEHFSSIETRYQDSLNDIHCQEPDSIDLVQKCQDSQPPLSIHTSTWQQLSLLSSTYGTTANENSQPSETISNLQNLSTLQNSQTHCIYEPHPVPLPSQHTPTPNYTTHLDTLNVPHTRSMDLALLPNWSTNAALEAHNWVLDLAIARTQDMIEQAHAGELGILDPPTTSAECGFYTNSTIGESLPHIVDSRLLDNEVQPVGRILGEIEATSETELIEQPLSPIQAAGPQVLVDHDIVGDIDEENLSADATGFHNTSIRQNDYDGSHRGSLQNHRDESINPNFSPDPQTNQLVFSDSIKIEHPDHERHPDTSGEVQKKDSGKREVVFLESRELHDHQMRDDFEENPETVDQLGNNEQIMHPSFPDTSPSPISSIPPEQDQTNPALNTNHPTLPSTIYLQESTATQRTVSLNLGSPRQ